MNAPPSSSADLAFASAQELHGWYASKSVSPVEVANAVLARIEAWNPVVNAYCYLDPERTLADARASEARWGKGEALGLADGVPYGVKDLLVVAGCPTGLGSKTSQQTQRSENDAPSVARLREAGAVFVGKTNTSEFGWKGTGDSLLHGPTRNVWNPALTSGGSSGGAASAAAAGLGTFQLGTDGGGSTRIPAAFSGIAGAKATFGRVAAWPAGPMLTLSNVGPMARTAQDVSDLYDIIGQADQRDWNNVPKPAGRRPKATELTGLRVGLYTGEGHCEPAVEAVFQAAIRALAKAGVRIEPIELPFAGALELQQAHWEAGAAWLVSQVPEDRQSLLDPGLQDAALRGSKRHLPEYYRAMVMRQKLGEAMQAKLSTVDVVLTPTLPILAFPAGLLAPPGAASQEWLEWNPYTYPFNLTRQPAISIPAGWSAEGLPVGLQLATTLYEDDFLMSVACLMEKALHVEQRRPTLVNRTTA